MSSEDRSGSGADEKRPQLRITDPKMMRALAHPLRVALLEAIAMAEGQTLTATQASELLGESPANCAFHLRTLSKYGFVAEAGGGRGRERPWRLSFSGFDFIPPWQTPESRMALEAMGSVWLGRWLDRVRDRLLRIVGHPAEWQAAAIASQSTMYLTAQEARDLEQALREPLKAFAERLQNPALRPPGSLPYEVLMFGYPLTDPPAED